MIYRYIYIYICIYVYIYMYIYIYIYIYRYNPIIARSCLACCFLPCYLTRTQRGMTTNSASAEYLTRQKGVRFFPTPPCKVSRINKRKGRSPPAMSFLHRYVSMYVKVCVSLYIWLFLFCMVVASNS